MNFLEWIGGIVCLLGAITLAITSWQILVSFAIVGFFETIDKILRFNDKLKQ